MFLRVNSYPESFSFVLFSPRSCVCFYSWATSEAGFFFKNDFNEAIGSFQVKKKKRNIPASPSSIPAFPPSVLSFSSSLCSKPVTCRHQRQTQREGYNWCEKHQTHKSRIFFIFFFFLETCHSPIYFYFWPLETCCVSCLFSFHPFHLEVKGYSA